MSSKLTKTIIGAVVAVALAAAVSYGLISQQTADQIQTQANRTLQEQGTAPAPQAPAPQAPASQSPDPQAPVPAPQTPSPAPR